MDDKNSPLQIEIDENISRGMYTNLALITHSETELLIDFVFLQPQAAKTKVLARMITSPLHAKRLLAALQENIAKYESRFGVIQAGEPQDSPRPSTYQ